MTFYLWNNSLSPGCGIPDYPDCRSKVARPLDSLLMNRKKKIKTNVHMNILFKITNIKISVKVQFLCDTFTHSSTMQYT
jgi:hypothetical protein